MNLLICMSIQNSQLMDCPLLVLDDTFHILAHYKTDGFADPLFDKAVQLGQITYEAGAIISKNARISAGQPDYIDLAGTPFRRRFAPLVSARRTARLSHLRGFGRASADSFGGRFPNGGNRAGQAVADGSGATGTTLRNPQRKF